MDITLREFTRDDLRRLDEWATNIGSDDFMSRYRPMDHSVTEHSPVAGVLWFVICSSDQDIGTVWLERAATPEQAILGIFLGNQSLFGRGIGREAIRLALERATELDGVRSVLLNVREGNRRAITCYKKCGFCQIAKGVKRASSGAEIHYLTMQHILLHQSE